jgi:succinate-acetate transporter protein
MLAVVWAFLLAAIPWLAGGHSASVRRGGYLGLVTAALAGYLGAAGICEYSYGQPVLPVWSLARR